MVGVGSTHNRFRDPPSPSQVQVALEVSSDACTVGGSPPFILKVHLANLTRETITIRTHGTILDIEDAWFNNKFNFTHVGTGRTVLRFPQPPRPSYDTSVGASSLLPDYVELKADGVHTFEKVINGVGPLTAGPLGFGGPYSEGRDIWANDHGCRLSEVNRDRTMLAGLEAGETYEMRAKESEIRSWAYGGQGQLHKREREYPYRIPKHLILGVADWGSVTFTVVDDQVGKQRSLSPQSRSSTTIS